jgi:hypothetical protein
MPVMTFTLDTSAVLAAVNDEPEAGDIDQLVELARLGHIRIAITSGFEVDQRRATDDQRRLNLDYLSHRPVLRVPGPFRFDMSTFDGPDVLLDDDTARVDELISNIVLPRGRKPETAGKRMNDVHHLTAHYMAGHDVFVAKDDDDMIKKGKRERLLAEVRITVMTPAEAVEHALSRSSMR